MFIFSCSSVLHKLSELIIIASDISSIVMFSRKFNAISLRRCTEHKGATLSFHRSDPIIIRNDESTMGGVGEKL